jgi:hypothetical protein
MGVEFVIEGQPEPALEIEDDLESALDDIGGWTLLLRVADARYNWDCVLVSPPNLAAFETGCTDLAEQFGSGESALTTTWHDPRGHIHSSEITRAELRHIILEIGRVARMAHEVGESLTIRWDRDWVEATVWQNAQEADKHR